MDVELVRLYARRENDVAGRKDEDSLPFTAFADVDTSGTLKVRSGSGSDLQTECGSEWAAYIGGCVYGGDVFEELRTGGPGVNRLPERDLDVGDLKLLRISLQPTAATLAFSRERDPGFTPTQRKRGPASFSTSAKRTGSMIVRLTLTELVDLLT